MTLLTLTGVDGATSASFIQATTHRYGDKYGHVAVEFAILRSPKVGQSPRYPTTRQIQAITRHVYPRSLAYHLCGDYARMALSRSRWLELVNIIEFADVSRVQVNSRECTAESIVTLQAFAKFINKPVIMQWRKPIFDYISGLDLLQDNSGGTGVLESNWASPGDLSVGGRIGYAGGLNPENIDAEYPKIQKAARGKFFSIDCESGIRTNDLFDQDKAQAMIDAVLRHNPHMRDTKPQGL